MQNDSTWIQTFSGRQFWPLEPRPEDIDIRDVAHSLSMLCRFNGHCREFYSVAEHCVRVSGACPAEDALWGLLHDLAEAYFGDFPRPVKEQFPDIARMEERLLRAAATRFGLAWPMPAPVRRFDEILLATEARDLMGLPPADWRLEAVPLKAHIVPLSPAEAKRAFLKRFQELHREKAPAQQPDQAP